jgi:hypothetical protein
LTNELRGAEMFPFFLFYFVRYGTSFDILRYITTTTMEDYKLKRLQEKRLEIVRNGFYHFAIIVGSIAIIFKLIILILI